MAGPRKAGVAAQAKARAEDALAEVDPRIKALLAMDRAQVEAWVAANITTLAAARAFLIDLAALLLKVLRNGR
jgi:hypothetical protein